MLGQGRGGLGGVHGSCRRHGVLCGPDAGDICRQTFSTPSGVLGLSGGLLGREAATAQSFVSSLRVATPDLDRWVLYLSGGNQQKVVITKWLAARCPVLIVDEPTRGVDVGAKAEIHALIGSLAADGTAVLLISSELPEVLQLSSRILVFREGRVVAEYDRGSATQDSLMRAMAGVA